VVGAGEPSTGSACAVLQGEAQRHTTPDPTGRRPPTAVDLAIAPCSSALRGSATTPGWSSWRGRRGASRDGLLCLAPRRPAAASAEPCDPAATSATAVCCGRRSTHGSGGRERRWASRAAIGKRRHRARALVEKDATDLKPSAEMADAEVKSPGSEVERAAARAGQQRLRGNKELLTCSACGDEGKTAWERALSMCTLVCYVASRNFTCTCSV
jgi:hypothetical protein